MFSFEEELVLRSYGYCNFQDNGKITAATKRISFCMFTIHKVHESVEGKSDLNINECYRMSVFFKGNDNEVHLWKRTNFDLLSDIGCVEARMMPDNSWLGESKRWWN